MFVSFYFGYVISLSRRASSLVTADQLIDTMMQYTGLVESDSYRLKKIKKMNK